MLDRTRIPLLVALILLLAIPSLCFASSEAIMIEIATTTAGVSYKIENKPRIPGDPKTPEEIEAWLGELVKGAGGHDVPILVYPDDRTSFKTVLDLLRRFKAAGIKGFIVISKEQGDTSAAGSFLRGSVKEVGTY